MANTCETTSPFLATQCSVQADRIQELEDCIRQMASLPRCMRTCSDRIAAPEREIYLKACEYAQRELRRIALMHSVRV